MSASQLNRPHSRRRWLPLVGVLLLIEFVDELIFGAREAAWPLLRADLGLTYAEIGLLLSVPKLAASVIEPFLGVLGDQGWRRALVLGGGLVFAGACLLAGLAPGLELLLAAFILLYPASGAFVSLAQAALMDTDPARHEHLMARWTLAGSLGVVAGPIVLTVVGWAGLSWRSAYISLAILAILLVLFTARTRFPSPPMSEDGEAPPPANARSILRAIRRRDVQHWLILLMFADFILDVLLGYLALYFVDVVGTTPEQGALAVGVFTGVGLLSDALLIPLLTRVSGLSYLRWSTALMVIVYPTFLLVPGFEVKLVLIGLVGLLNAGWYAILKAQMYGTLPGQSGTVLAIDSVFGFIEKLVPLGLGLLAARAGLNVALWVLVLGPIVVWLGVRRPPAKPG